MFKFRFRNNYEKTVVYRAFVLEVIPCWDSSPDGSGIYDYQITVEPMDASGRTFGAKMIQEFGSNLSKDTDGVVLNMPTNRFKITAEMGTDYIDIGVEVLDETDLRVVEME